MDNQMYSVSQIKKLRRLSKKMARKVNEALLFQILKDTMAGCNRIVVHELYEILLRKVHRHITRATACRIEKYFSENDRLHFDGYISFRAKKEREEITLLVESIVKEFALQRSYESFINLLRSYTKTGCNGEAVHIYQLKSRYIVLNSSFAPIGNEAVFDADYLLSELLDRLPKKITFHHFMDCKLEKIVETIKKIFEGRVEICYIRYI